MITIAENICLWLWEVSREEIKRRTYMMRREMMYASDTLLFRKSKQTILIEKIHVCLLLLTRFIISFWLVLDWIFSMDWWRRNRFYSIEQWNNLYAVWSSVLRRKEKWWRRSLSSSPNMKITLDIRGIICFLFYSSMNACVHNIVQDVTNRHVWLWNDIDNLE